MAKKPIRLKVPVGPAELENDPLTEVSLREECLLDGSFLKLVREDVRLPDGREAKRFGLRHGGAAGMVALDDEGCIILERQWRHPLRRAFWEIPAGKLDPNEAEIDCAKRELHEECGCRADEWTRLGMLNNAIGYSNERIVIFLAEKLHWGKQALDDGEHLEVYRVPVKEAVEMCGDGRITDVKTIVAVFWLKRLLKARRKAERDARKEKKARQRSGKERRELNKAAAKQAGKKLRRNALLAEDSGTND